MAIAFASLALAAPVTAISAMTVTPSPSATIFRGEVGAHLVQRGAERPVACRRAPDPARAVREQQHRVVRRALAVDGDRVERLVDGRPEELDRLARLERVVGRHESEHRREVGMDHSRTLRHAADGEAVARRPRSSSGVVSVVMIASAAAVAPLAGEWPDGSPGAR